jgi:hypothetical protein
VSNDSKLVDFHFQRQEPIQQNTQHSSIYKSQLVERFQNNICAKNESAERGGSRKKMEFSVIRFGAGRRFIYFPAAAFRFLDI